MEGRPCLCCTIQSTLKQARLQDLCMYCYCSMCSDNPCLCFWSIIFPHHIGNVTHFLLLMVAHSQLHFASSKVTRCGVCRLSPTHSSDSAAFQNQTAAIFSTLNTDPTTHRVSAEDCQHCSEASVKNATTKKAAVFNLEQYNKAEQLNVFTMDLQNITKNNCNCS